MMVDRGIQATPGLPRNRALQYYSLGVGEEERAGMLGSDELASFLKRVVPLCERALQQNEVVNIYEDEIRSLLDEEAASGSKADK